MSMLQVKPEPVMDRRLSTDDLTELMLRPGKWLTSVNFSFTNRCNVRCVYCPQGTHPDGFHADSPRGMIDHIKDYIRDKDIRSAGIGYYGETLMIKGWEEDCAELVDQGLELHINSSFSRILTEREAAVLSRFRSVYMSIDTVDLPLHKIIRKAVDARNIVYDMHMIRGHAIRNGWEPPLITWTGVMTDKAVFRLREYVAAAISNGVPAINFNDLADYEGVKGGVRHIVELEGAELVRAIEEIKGAVDLATKHKVPLSLGGVDRLLAKLQGRHDDRKLYKIGGIQGVAPALTTPVKPGETRRCMDPWDTVFTDPKGEVYSCCVRGEVMGKLSDKVGLDDVLNNDNYRKLRMELLTGQNMNETCANCHLRPAVPVATFQAQMAQVVHQRHSIPRPPKVLPATPVLDSLLPPIPGSDAESSGT